MFSDIFFYTILSICMIVMIHYIYDFIFNKVILDKPKPLHPILIKENNENNTKPDNKSDKTVTFSDDTKEMTDDTKEKIKQDLKDYIKGLSHKHPKLSKTSNVDVNIASKTDPQEHIENVGRAFFNNPSTSLLNQNGENNLNQNEPFAANNDNDLFASF